MRISGAGVPLLKHLMLDLTQAWHDTIMNHEVAGLLARRWENNVYLETAKALWQSAMNRRRLYMLRCPLCSHILRDFHMPLK